MATQDFFNIGLYVNGVITPYSSSQIIKLRNFRNDTINFPQTRFGLNQIKIGYKKPWRQVYFDISSSYSLPGVGISIFQYTTLIDGRRGFRPVGDYIDDETAIWQNSGIIRFKEVPPNWGTDSQGDYSLLLTCRVANEDDAPVSWDIPMRGINYVFSDDNDLQRIRSDILEASQGAGWGPKHVYARDFIMQQLRIKYSKKDLTAFDILNPGDLREASTFLTLYAIYKFELSKLNGDLFDTQSKEFYKKAIRSFDLYNLSIDTNDDGMLTDADDTLVPDDAITKVDLEWT